MAKITLDGHEITKLVLKPATGASVTKNLVATNSFDSSDEGKVVSNGALKAQTSQNITENGTFDTTDKNSVVVNVQGSISVDDWDIYDKELVDTWSDTVNLHSDTTFDNITPSTSAQNFELKTPISRTVEVDLTNYCYLFRKEQYIKAVYSGETQANYFAKKVFFKHLALYVNPAGLNAYIDIPSVAMQYFYNASGEVVANGNLASYGIYETGAYDGPTYTGSGGTHITNITFGSPKWSVRGSQTVKPEYIAAIDSANSFIQYRYSLYRMPIETLIGTSSEEIKYVVENDGLRSLSSSD